MNSDILPKENFLPVDFDEDLIRRNRMAAKADESKRALVKNWRMFEAWCGKQGVSPLPAELNTVEMYLVYLSDYHPVFDQKGIQIRLGMKVSAISQALWAINSTHRIQGFPPPGEFEQIKNAMGGIKRRKGSRKKQQSPLTIEHIKDIRFRTDLKGMRDKALLLVGFAGCFRRSELVSLRAEDIEESPFGLRVYLENSKTDQEGQGEWVDILASELYPEYCPVAALREWLKHSGISQGPIFRSLTKGGKPKLGRKLSGVSVDAIVKWAAEECGLDRNKYGGHSLRAGKATYLSEKGKSVTLIARHGRWKSLDMVLTYCRVETSRELAGAY